MHITIGGAVTLAVLIIVWVFAVSISNDAVCQSNEAVSFMAEPFKALLRPFLLCWLV